MTAPRPPAAPDWLTVVAIAVTVHALSTSAHEALGHGGGCLIVGCTPQLVTSMQFLGDDSMLGPAARRVIEAGGTAMNVIVAAVAIGLLRGQREDQSASASWFFLWLLATVNLLAATGYFLYSGVAGIGDWSDFIKGLHPYWLWRLVLAIVGGVGYYAAVRWAMMELGARLVGEPSNRVRGASRLSLLSYAAIGLLSIAAGAFEPGGAFIVLISGAAASLGGASGLAWGPQLLRNPRLVANVEAPLSLHRDWRWIVAGFVAAALFVFVLGRGIRL